MAATSAHLGGINLRWSIIIWSNDQFDQSSDQRDNYCVNIFYQVCEADCKTPGRTTGASTWSRWKEEVWFVCNVCIIIITAPENIQWEVSVCSLSVADLPPPLFETEGSTKAHCTKAWHCEGLLFPLVENGLSAPTGITI